MLSLDMTANACYEPLEEIVHLGNEELRFLRDTLTQARDDSIRIDVIRPTDPVLEETFLIYRSGLHTGPCTHTRDDASIFVLGGVADLLLFDDCGTLTKTVPLGERQSGMPYFCRIPRGICHSLAPRSDGFLCIKAMSGPSSFVMPLSGAPAAATNTPERPASTAAIATTAPPQPDAPLIPLVIDSPQVMTATATIVTLSETENRFLLSERVHRGLDRLRICMHKGVDERLHEMLMAFAASTYIRPSLHIDKEESLLVVHGLATLILYDDHGTITSTVRLGTPESGRAFYCRVPANTFHSLAVESAEILLKETARGPFNRADTVFPAWAPDGNDPHESTRYLRAQMAFISSDVRDPKHHQAQNVPLQ